MERVSPPCICTTRRPRKAFPWILFRSPRNRSPGGSSAPIPPSTNGWPRGPSSCRGLRRSSEDDETSLMRARRLDFAQRPFRDERPVFLVAGLAFVAAALLFAANVQLYRDFHREIEGTGRQIEFLEKRRDKAPREEEADRP